MRAVQQQQGIALFQVLLLSVILSLLALFISQKVGQQTQAALRLTDKMQAMMLAKSAETELMVVLLTQSIEDYRGITGWNLYGEFFELKPGVQVSIQDMNGLIAFDHALNESLLTSLIRQSGLTSQPEVVGQSLLDFIDLDTQERGPKTESNSFGVALPNHWMQHPSELRYLKGMTSELLVYLTDYLNWYSFGTYNPSTSPEPVLRFLFGNNTAKEIQSLRQKRLEYRDFYGRVAQLTAKGEQESTVSYTGPVYSIQLKASSGEGFWAYKLVIFLDKQNLKEPLLIMSRETVFQDV